MSFCLHSSEPVRHQLSMGCPASVEITLDNREMKTVQKKTFEWTKGDLSRCEVSSHTSTTFSRSLSELVKTNV